MRSFPRTMVAMALAIGITSTGICSGVSIALADHRVVTGGRMVNGTTANSIEGNFRVSLKLKKTPSNPYDAVPEGELPPGPISGVTFTLDQVNGIRVDSEPDYSAAKEFTLERAHDTGLVRIATGETDALGELVFENLEPGLYLVTEVLAVADQYALKTSSPFLVILPLVTPEGTGFQQDNVVVVKDHVAKGEIDPFEVPTKSPSPDPFNGESSGFTRQPHETSESGSPRRSNVNDVPTNASDGSTGSPDAPAKESDNGAGRVRQALSRLAETGASVIVVTMVGLFLLISGFILLLKHRQESD